MRHIRLEKPVQGSEYYEDFQKWDTKAKQLIEELKAAPDMKARKQIIDDNKTFWGELKAWLLSLSNQRCWFSEAQDCFSHWEVEHFRPKKTTKDETGKEYDGYWWLAFDWNNFRICGNVGNRKKGTYFPLQDESKRVLKPEDDYRYEPCLLLDPINAHDSSLIFFNMEGEAIPDPHIASEWERKRVVESVKRFRLDFPALERKRGIVWNNCWNCIQKYLEELDKLYKGDQDNPIARQELANKADAIKELVSGATELSSVARACVLSTNDPRVIRLLR
ncbi:hypothetical protein [Nodosilinea sp. E11]|uniref:hypothetical protein n=1 Tax=Nodosilinea sp. E11 TaxID=3037479 RepID=UPI002934E0C5|nr:hypothetical protein [Nodosilinea sp. E11]WOD41910.1 hypothetical protein RRF56_14030 [Nodosilinea sp. E11]